jgi:hypothetical protein
VLIVAETSKSLMPLLFDLTVLCGLFLLGAVVLKLL